VDERHLKYLYTALAVLFGLPSLVMGGAAATMLLLMGLGQFGHGTLASVTVMPLWGLAGIAGCLAWLWLSAGFLLQGRAGLHVHRLWWWMLLAGGLAAPLRGADPSMGAEAIVIAFVVVVLGGIGSFSGPLVGGLIIGVTQSMMSAIWPEGARLAIFIVMAGILLVMPKGLFGRA